MRNGTSERNYITNTELALYEAILTFGVKGTSGFV